MSYQVLARKWRPRTFSEMVGQEHVLRALINALDNDRLHHAYLFTGTRGVGKTTVARIFAKSLNCEQGVSSTPCGQCASCREIDEGRFVDLIEVDAASRTKVEDTRELLENVQYAPTRGRYKVYLVDEVHMLSTHSFNALLKTLEEPPPHVKFLLATTDPQKLPVTILSRCLQFNLKRMPQTLIAQHLRRILGEEGVDHEAEALEQLARAADGSMRDALSLLDQAIAFGGGRVAEADVRAMLGTIEQDHVYALMEALAVNDGGAVLARVEQLSQQAPDYAGVLADLISLLHQMALVQAVPACLEEIGGDRSRLEGLAHRVSSEDVQLFYQIGLIGRRDLPLAPDSRSGFEMVLLRMLAFRPAEAERVQASRPVPAPAAVSPAPSAGIQSAGASPAKPAVSAPVSPPTTMPATAPEPVLAEAQPESGLPPQVPWVEVVSRLGLKGMAHELAAHCGFDSREGDVIHLSLDRAHDRLRGPNMEERLKNALQAYCGATVKLMIRIGTPAQETLAERRQRETEERQQAAVTSIAEDPNIQAFREVFDAQVDPAASRPLD